MKVLLPDLIIAGGLALAATIPFASCEAHGAPADQVAEKLTHRVLTYTPTWYPPGKAPETTVDREERWAAIVETAWQQSQEGQNPMWPNDQVALVLATWKFESALDYHVHGGEESPIGTQDNGKARCMGQLHHIKSWWTEAEWKALAGRDYEATVRCARATLRFFWYHAQRCKLRHDLPKATRWKSMLSMQEMRILMGAYATGNQCKPLEWQHYRWKEFDTLRELTL